MAVEELPQLAYGVAADGGLRVNLYGAGQATLAHPAAGKVTLQQVTRYPFAGAIEIRVTPEHAAQFAIGVRIPAWARNATITVNGVNQQATIGNDGFSVLARQWQPGDVIVVVLPLQPALHRAANINVQESRAPDGSPVAQEVLRWEYAAVSYGPLVYATGLIDGYKTEETVILPDAPPGDWIEVGPDHGSGASLTLRLECRSPLVFEPYYRCGGREHGAWRLTWLPLAPAR